VQAIQGRRGHTQTYSQNVPIHIDKEPDANNRKLDDRRQSSSRAHFHTALNLREVLPNDRTLKELDNSGTKSAVTSHRHPFATTTDRYPARAKDTACLSIRLSAPIGTGVTDTTVNGSFMLHGSFHTDTLNTRPQIPMLTIRQTVKSSGRPPSSISRTKARVPTGLSSPG